MTGRFIFKTDHGAEMQFANKLAMCGTEDVASAGRRIVKNAVDWITTSCGVPECAIFDFFSNRTPEGKKVVYEVTREAYIRETINDWKSGKDEWTVQMEGDEISFLTEKHGVQNRELDTATKVFRDNWCSRCRCEHDHGSLEDHCREVHEWGSVTAGRLLYWTVQHIGAENP